MEGGSSHGHRAQVYVERAEGAKCSPHGPVPRAPDSIIAALAERQHGVVARRQLMAEGIGRDAITGRLQRGSLHPVHRGVYAVGHPLLGVEGRWMAAILASGPQALLSHRSAARLWGLMRSPLAMVEVTRPGKFRSRAGIVAHRSFVPPDERTVVDGVPVTSLPRTILDTATCASRREVERALHEAEVLGLTDRLSLPDLLNRYPGRRGTGVVREILGDWNATRGVTRNEFEESFALLLDAHGLAKPRFNADLVVGGRRFNVDCLWQEAGLIVELDGRAVHGTRKSFELDRERDRTLLVAGWTVVRVTWRQLRDDSATVARDLRRVLQMRGLH